MGRSGAYNQIFFDAAFRFDRLFVTANFCSPRTAALFRLLEGLPFFRDPAVFFVDGRAVFLLAADLPEDPRLLVADADDFVAFTIDGALGQA